MKNAYVIVDAYNSGRLLLDLFKNKLKDDPGTVVVHVQSTPDFFAKMSPPEVDKYAENIVLSGDVEEVIEALKKYHVLAVLPGQEPGVELADLLSDRLGLDSSNGVRLSSARRNKFDMVKAVSDAGLAAPKFLKTSSLSEILNWVQANTQYPVVLKALRSAATDGVYISGNEEELRTAFAKLVGSTTIYNEINEEILIESFLDGDEYVVNAVSLNGEHFVTDVWVYQKQFLAGHGYIYDKVLLLPSDVSKVKELIDYNAKVLDALEVRNGPSHAEIMYTSNGPVLVEVGARLSGVVHPALNTACLGHHQAQLTVDCYADKASFIKTVENFPYVQKQHGMVVDLIYDGLSGKIELIDDEVLTQIKQLKSVMQVIVRAQKGDNLSPTRTLMNSPMRLFMGHADSTQLDDDYVTLQQLKRRLFRIIPESVSRPMSLIENNARLNDLAVQNNSISGGNVEESVAMRGAVNS